MGPIWMGMLHCLLTSLLTSRVSVSHMTVSLLWSMGPIWMGMLHCLLTSLLTSRVSVSHMTVGLLWSLLVGCLTSQQHASVSQGRICTDNFTCCHTEIEAADQTFHLTQSQYTDTGPTSPSADPITPGAWQGSHWSANFKVTGMTRPRKIPPPSGFEPGTFRSRGGRLNHYTNKAVLLWSMGPIWMGMLHCLLTSSAAAVCGGTSPSFQYKLKLRLW